MRLTCPNCAAQYEVPDEVIPEEGRDVQCSACGDTWFQLHPNHPNYVSAFDPDAPEDEADDRTAVESAADDPPDDTSVQDHSEDDQDQGNQGEDDQETRVSSAPRRELSDDVTNVLREEADREKRAREADMGGSLETQPDLGISEADDIDRRTRQAKERMARLRGFDEAQDEPVSDLVQTPDPDAPAEPEIDLGTRSNLLPDVEDVDQKIEAQSETAAEASSARDGSRVATQKEGRSGFARGLRISILLVVMATALYVFAPQLVQAVPALKEPMIAYSQMIDQGRAALQGLISR